MKNQVSLIGRVGQTPEIKVLDNGVKRAKFSLATNDYYITRDGERKEQTQWHNIVVWGKTADVVERYVSKGRLVGVEGKLEYRQFEDSEGRKHYFTEIRANDLLLLDRK
ncbi:MAG: single-stranded DNA-binding protein [Chlorobi bacterium]|nr:single-stranded DNA-binding protein [Chlorobiota bacterium]